MGLSRLSDKCRSCPFVDECEHKRMEALAYLPEPLIAPAAESVTQPLTQPILRETMTIYVDGKQLTVYKDDILKELNKSLYKHLQLPLM